MLAVPIHAWFVPVPSAEEPWCRENLGADYDGYLAELPGPSQAPKKGFGLSRPSGRRAASSALCYFRSVLFREGAR